MYMHIYMLMLILVIYLFLHTFFFFLTIYRQREEDWVWHTLDTDILLIFKKLSQHWYIYYHMPTVLNNANNKIILPENIFDLVIHNCYSYCWTLSTQMCVYMCVCVLVCVPN